MSPAHGPAWARLVPPLLVALATLFNAVAYRDEIARAAPELNDHVLHLALCQRMDSALWAGRDPLDPWIPEWGQGFPVVRYYQHLPHLAVVLIHRLLGGAVSLEAVFDGFRWLLLVLVPAAFYRGARWLGLPPIAAALVALCAPFLGADANQRYFFGFQQTAFTWYGGGLFTQLAGLVLFPLALGATSRAVLTGRRLAVALALLSALVLSHLLLGVMAGTLGLLLPLRAEARGQRSAAALRLLALYAGSALVASHQLLPILLESDLLNRSVWEDAVYWDSFGAEKVLAALVGGRLLDGSRWPVLTMAAGAGLLVVSGQRWWARRRAPLAGGAGAFAVLALLLSTALYFGRPTWGAALDVIPLAATLPWHRFLCAVQLSGLLLAGLALAGLWRVLGWERAPWRAALAALVTAAVLLPAVGDTAQRVAHGRRLQRQAELAYNEQGPALEAAFRELAALEQEAPGRGHGGTSWDWGRTFQYAGAPVWTYWGRHGLPAISYMFHTMGPASDIEVHFDARRPDHYALFNVRYLLAPSREQLPSFAEPIGEWPGLLAARVDTPGYFDVVRADRSTPAHTGELRWRAQRLFVAGPWHARGEYVRLALDEAPAFPPVDPAELERPPAERPRPGRVVESGRDGDVYTAHIEADEPAVLLFRMTWHPGWHVTVDGAPVETFMLAPGHLGASVAAGAHHVIAAYRGTRWTSALAILGLLVVVAALVAEPLLGRLRRSKHEGGSLKGGDPHLRSDLP